MKNEHLFWYRVVADANPGWTIAFAPGVEPGQVQISSCDTFFYVADTKSGWITAAATSAQAFLDLKSTFPKILKQSGLTADRIVGMAAGLTMDAAAVNAAPNSQESIRAINGVAFALADTQTFDVVRAQTGGVAGHWIYVIYTGRDGSLIGRPCYMSGPRKVFLDDAKLVGTIDQIIWSDRQAKSSFVGKQLAAVGGPVLHDTFKIR